ncbi:MAG: hypothetical protein COA58_02290 [Bacteroidetes bacterium]|nr:MAG: hypothetical protein COA58_02290 [Bacteroidota bacterium]
MIKQKVITPEEEYEIVLAALKNPAEFRILYDLHYTAIFRFVHSRVSDINAVADVVSDVFYSALTKLSTYSYKGYSIKSWLYKIAYNQIMSLYRSESKIRTVSLDTEDLETLADDGESRSFLDLDVLKRGLNQLSDEDLSLVEMKYFEKISYREMGQILGITEVNAKVKTHRVIKKLRGLIVK